MHCLARTSSSPQDSSFKNCFRASPAPKHKPRSSSGFTALPFLPSDRQDYIDAAMLRSTCRRAGVQVGTVDALLAQLCLRHELTLLTTDHDFLHIAKHLPLRVWSAKPRTRR